MISGKAVAIWMLLAVITALITYGLRQTTHIPRCGHDSRQGRHDSHQRCDSNPDEMKGGIGKDGMGKSGRCEIKSDRCEIKGCENWYAAIPILVFYIAFVLTITIIERTPGKLMKYNLELFWTVREIISGRTELISEIFWNIVLFVPIGVLMSIVLLGKAERCEQPEKQQKPHKLCRSGKRVCRLGNNPWIVILIGFLFSTGIEVTQLLTYRGLFEFDDIFYNTLGTAIGVAAFHAVRSRQRSHLRHRRRSFFYVSYEWLLTGEGKIEKFEKAVVDDKLIEWLKNHPEIVKELRIRGGLD